MPRRSAQKPKDARADANGEGAKNAGEHPSDLRLVANLLALHLVKGETLRTQAVTLTSAGFSIREAAALLNTEPNNISVALYQAGREGTSRRVVRRERRGASGAAEGGGS